MTIKEMRERKSELGYTDKTIAEYSGLPLETVKKVLSGDTEPQQKEAILALTEVLYKPRRMYDPDADGAQPISLFAQCSVEGPSGQKHYTVKDLDRFPDDALVELIDGTLYDLASCTLSHQTIAQSLLFTLAKWADAQPGFYLVIYGVGVQLDKDPYTEVIPDISIICDPEKVKGHSVLYGAPDMIIEILSSSNRWYELVLKLHKYKNANVREYWVVDPDTKRILVYNFTEDDFPQSYTFSDVIPVGISHGTCSIDFSKIDDELKIFE